MSRGANELQKALFIEVLNVVPGAGDRLVGYTDVVDAWLSELKPVLSALAGLGRAAVRMGRSDRNTMLLDFMRAMDALPHATLRWLNRWGCLRELVSSDALRGLSEEECRARFQTLATLDEGL